MGEPNESPNAGVALYDALTGAYELNPAEEEIAAQAARVAEHLQRIDTELLAEPSLVVKGSTGQMVSHPLLATSATLRRTLAALLDALHLPDDDDATVPLPEDVARLLPKRAAGG